MYPSILWKSDVNSPISQLRTQKPISEIIWLDREPWVHRKRNQQPSWIVKGKISLPNLDSRICPISDLWCFELYKHVIRRERKSSSLKFMIMSRTTIKISLYHLNLHRHCTQCILTVSNIPKSRLVQMTSTVTKFFLVTSYHTRQCSNSWCSVRTRLRATNLFCHCCTTRGGQNLERVFRYCNCTTHTDNEYPQYTPEIHGSRRWTRNDQDGDEPVMTKTYVLAQMDSGTQTFAFENHTSFNWLWYE